MRGSAIYTQISLATICIMLQGVRGYGILFPSFFCLKSFDCRLKSCLLLGCGTLMAYLTDTIPSERPSRVKSGMKPEVTITGFEIPLDWNVIFVTTGGNIYKLSSLILNTLWELWWALGILLTIDRWQQGQSESK